MTQVIENIIGTEVITVGIQGPASIGNHADFTTISGTSYTFVLDDKGKIVRSTSASNTIYTIPNDSSVFFATGDLIAISRSGDGELTIAGASGVTIQSPNSYTKVTPKFGKALLVKVAANQWELSGDLGT